MPWMFVTFLKVFPSRTAEFTSLAEKWAMRLLHSGLYIVSLLQSLSCLSLSRREECFSYQLVQETLQQQFGSRTVLGHERGYGFLYPRRRQ